MKSMVPFLLFAIMLLSCSGSANKDLIVYNELNDALVRSRDIVVLSNDEMYRDFYKKVNDPVTGSMAKKFLSEVEMIKTKTDSMIRFVKSFKNNCTKFSERDVEKTAENFHSRLSDYTNTITSVSKYLQQHILQKGNSTLYGADSSNSDFIKKYFRNKSAVAVKTMLTKFETDIRLLENDFISYENTRLSGCILEYTSFSTIVGQNSSILKVGDTIEIMAGVGEFTRVCAPKILINNKRVGLNEGAVASFKLKTNNKPGNYSIPVSIEFTKPDGTIELTKTNVEYTIKE